MKKKTTIKKEDFINILVDCNGYGEDEAQEMAEEYKGNYNEFIEELGEGSLEEALNFIN